MNSKPNGAENPDLLDFAEEREAAEREAIAEANTRRAMARERIAKMKTALTEAEIYDGTSYWNVAILIAKVSDAWKPLEWSLDRLAMDDDLGSESGELVSRKRIVRRALKRLTERGILNSKIVTTGRGRAAKANVTATVCRSVITESRPENRCEIMPPIMPKNRDNLTDNERDNLKDRTGTTSGTKPGQVEKHTALYSISKESGPFNPLEANRREAKEDHRFSTTAEETAPRAARLMMTLGWPAGDVETAWRVAAACNAGLISDGDADGAAQMARDYAKRSTVGLFRVKLAERLEIEPRDLARLLDRVRMRGGYPKEPPVRRLRPSAGTPAATLRRPEREPAKITEHATQSAAQRILRDLAKMELTK